jgi:predicted transcriptional regulator
MYQRGLTVAFKDILENLTAEKAPGPTSTFTVFDMWKALEVIAEENFIGRGRLSEKLGIGEGATRTLLSRLTGFHLVAMSKSGCMLTLQGRKLWQKIGNLMPVKAEIAKNELTFAGYNIALQVKGKGNKVKKGIEQRDAAVKVGAKGAITLIQKSDRLILPTISSDVATDFPDAYYHIMQLMHLDEDDVAIISCAEHPKDAEYGALAAAWTLL